MFEFLFKYPASVFSKGTFVFAGGWPLWLLGIAILAGVAIFTGMISCETGLGMLPTCGVPPADELVLPNSCPAT